MKFFPDSPEEFALACAKMSRVRFDVVVNLTEELSPQRIICHLMGFIDEDKIINTAKTRIEARLLKLCGELMLPQEQPGQTQKFSFLFDLCCIVIAMVRL